MHLIAGQRLGAFEIVATLGAGGMGEVYRARDTRLGREVAIKVLPSAVRDDRQALARLEREARAVAALSHPNVIALHDFLHEGEVAFAVMELLRGESLRQRLDAGTLPLNRAVELAAQTCQGLGAAHERGIVHRDLKPENLFVTDDGNLKILDFGLARLSPRGVSEDETATAGATSAGTILGTVGYMSPEQVRGDPADARSDIFSLGAVLYEMVTGRRAFKGGSAVETLNAILTEEPRIASSSGDELPGGLSRLIGRCLEKKPGDRFQSARDLGFALRGLLEPASSSTVGSGRPRRAWPGSFGRAGLAALGAALLLGGAGLVVRQVAGRSSRPASATLPARLALLPPDGTRFVLRQAPMVSPDGHWVAFVGSDLSGRTLLWVRSLADGSARALSGTDGAAWPFWSPDSRALAFFAQRALKRTSISGGPVQTVCDARNGRGGSWNATDVIVFSPGTDHPLFQVPATGGTPVQLTRLDASAGEASHRWPEFLPDGRRFLYLVWGGEESREVRLASLDSPRGRAVLSTLADARLLAPDRLLYVRDHSLMVQPFDQRAGAIRGEPTPIADDVGYDVYTQRSLFSVSSGGAVVYSSGGSASVTELRWLNRAGKAIAALGPPGVYSSPALSPDGRTLAYTQLDGSSGSTDVWLIDVDRQVPTRFTLERGDQGFPVWSPDGGALAFAQSTGAENAVVRKAVRGGGKEEQLFTSVSFATPQAWSPIDNGIPYMVQRPGSSVDILVGKGDGGSPRGLLDTPFDERQANLTMDGRAVAFIANESGGWEVYVAPVAAPEAKVQVTSGGGYQPRWRRDGRALFFLVPDGTLMEVAVEQPDLHVSTPVPLFQTGLDAANVFNVRNEYDVAPDGQRILVNAPVSTARATSLTVLLNWGTPSR